MVIQDWSITGGVTGILGSGVCVEKCPTLADQTITCKADPCPDAATVQLDSGSLDVLGICFPKSPPDEILQAIDMIKQQIIGSGVGPYLYDLYRSSRSIFLSLAMSVVYSILFIYFLSAFGETLAWICVFILQLSLIALGGLGWYAWDQSVKAG
jgi:hypothetical protein